MIRLGWGQALLGGVIASGVLGGALAVVASRRPETPGRNVFAVLAATQSGWCLAQALSWASPPGILALATDVLANVLAFASVLLWLTFALRYTGHGNWLRQRVRALLWGLLVAYALATFTNPWHGLVRTDVGYDTYATLTLVVSDLRLVGLLTYALAYATILLTYVLLGRFALRSRPGYRAQTVTILLASLVPTVANAVYFAGFRAHPGLDPSPLFFLWMVLVVGWALFRHDFLDVAPLATDLLIEEMADPVVVLDEEGRIVERNGAAADVLSTPSSHLSDAWPELDAALEAGTEEVSIAIDGEERIYDVRSTHVEDQHGISRGRLVVLRDVTAERRRARELERKNEQLERFASVVSHDLRNPLAVARGYAELVREGDEEAIEDILDALSQMESLIDDVLRLAREGRAVSDPDPVSLGEVAESAWDYVESGGATLVVEEDILIQADEDRLSELLGNLYRNALTHGEANLIRVGPLPDASGFYVADEGRGIPDEDRERVFESGYTSTEGGTGLGLAIVEAIATAHGWRVSVAESEGGGARFEFRTGGL